MEPFCENRKRKALWEALLDNRIDVIATDHCYTLRRKQQPYSKAPSGGPLVQHAVVCLRHTIKVRLV
jgi:dihydroorotase